MWIKNKNQSTYNNLTDLLKEDLILVMKPIFIFCTLENM